MAKTQRREDPGTWGTKQNEWQPVTIRAIAEPTVEQIDFDLSDDEKADATRIQAALELHRNEPLKRAR